MHLKCNIFKMCLSKKTKQLWDVATRGVHDCVFQDWFSLIAPLFAFVFLLWPLLPLDFVSCLFFFPSLEHNSRVTHWNTTVSCRQTGETRKQNKLVRIATLFLKTVLVVLAFYIYFLLD